MGYTGKSKVHHTYNTQRQMPEPGRTNMVVCDVQGNVVDFEIQEGKGDLRSYVLNLDERWEDEITRKPVKVFDREGDGAGFFSGMVRKENPFVTWEKHSDSKKLDAMPAELFSVSFEVNEKEGGGHRKIHLNIYKPAIPIITSRGTCLMKAKTSPSRTR